MRRKIASGSVLRRAYRDKKTGQRRHTRLWYLRYYVKGKPITISSGTEDYDQAVTTLRQRMAALSRDEHCSGIVRMNQLFDLVLEDYRINERHTTYDVERKIESSATSLVRRDEGSRCSQWL